jgi:hypothetical protein
MSRMPTTYRTPMGLPLNWRDQRSWSGELPAAVMTYYEHKAKGGSAPTEKQLELIRDYLVHYIEAPCWDEASPGGGWNELADLRKKASESSAVEDIGRFIWACLDVGMDPL